MSVLLLLSVCFASLVESCLVCCSSQVSKTALLSRVQMSAKAFFEGLNEGIAFLEVRVLIARLDRGSSIG